MSCGIVFGAKGRICPRPSCSSVALSLSLGFSQFGGAPTEIHLACNEMVSKSSNSLHRHTIYPLWMGNQATIYSYPVLPLLKYTNYPTEKKKNYIFRSASASAFPLPSSFFVFLFIRRFLSFNLYSTSL